MFSLGTPDRRFGRRELLRAGVIGSLGLAGPFARAGTSPNLPGELLRDKAVVFLFLHGGPTQIETFDPHMDAPDGVRSVTGETKTSIPGVTFGATFPKLAARADRLTVVRSFVPGASNHDLKTLVGKDSAGANLGSAYASAADGDQGRLGLPANVALFPQSIDPACQPMQTQFGNFLATGPFGPATAPFVPGGGGPMQENMTLTVAPDRLADRRHLLAAFDRGRAHLDADTAATTAARDAAFSVLLGNGAEAFDLTRESATTIAKYDTAPLLDPAKISDKWNNKKYYADNVATLGKLMLMARRLVERGAGFVTVTTNFVWDMHADKNNATITEGLGYVGAPFDHAVAAFLDDLRDRGLEDKVLLVCCGEIGRTPKVNKKGGRDHWGNLGPLVLAGGGLPRGQVIGRSTRTGGEPATDPVRIPNLMSTVLHTLFDVGQLRVTGGVSRDLLRMTEASPIPGTFSG